MKNLSKISNGVNKIKRFLKPRIKLAKGTRLVSLLFICISILIAAGVLWGANMYYDIDAGKIIVNEVQDIISTAAYQFKVAYNSSKYLTASVASSGTTTLAATGGLDVTAAATSTWKTTAGRLTLKTEGAGDDIFIIANDVFDLDATTLNLDASSAINIGTNADVPFDIDTAALTIDSSGNIVITSASTKSIALTSGDDFTITFDADDAFSLKDSASLEYFGVSAANVVTLTSGSATTTINGSTITLTGTSQVNGTLTVGANTAGYTVTFYGDTDTNKMVWNDASNKLVITGTAASNAFEIASGDASVQGKITVGVNDTGYDVTFYGATAGVTMLWDESANELIVTGVSGAEALRIAAGNAVIAAGSLAITNPVSLGQVALTVTQSTTSNNIVNFIGQASQQLSLGLDGDGNLILTSNTKLTITAGNNDIVIDTGTGTLRVPSGRITVENDAVLTEPGQQILRGMVPIFGFDLPAQTASTSYVTTTRVVENYTFPANASGTTRVHKLVFRYSASTTAAIDFQIYNITAGTTTASTLPDPVSDDLDKGNVYIATSTIPTPATIGPGDADDWVVKVKTPDVPSVVRIFQIFLAAYDQMP